MITVNDEKYYTPKEIAEKFNVTENTVSRWRREGKIKPHSISPRKHLFSENQIEQFITGEAKND